MLEQRLNRRLKAAERRLRWLRLLKTLSLLWLLAAALGLGLLVVAAWAPPRWLAIAWVGASLVAAVALGWGTLRRRFDPRQTARRIEACYPELDSRLLAAVEQRGEGAGARLGYLQSLVVDQALEHARRDNWRNATPASRSLGLSAMHAAALALFFAALVAVFHRPGFLTRGNPMSSVGGGAVEYDAVIEPGDVELERGASLVALARFAGSRLPAEVTLVYRPVDRSAQPGEQRLAMSKSLDDPLFAGRVADAQRDFEYYVAYGAQRSPSYRVTVFDYPELERADMKLAFPGYTGQPEAVVEDTRQITAVEGTRVTVIARLNKPVVDCRLVSDDRPPIEFVREPDSGRVRVATFTLEKTSRYRLKLRDEAERENRQPPEFVFTATVNRRPEIKLTFPGRDAHVSPLEEIELQASVWDDFGLASYGLAYSLDGQPASEIELGSAAPARQRREARRLVSFEALAAQPDQLLSYYFYADDVGPDGQRRRTSSDMFFCEVRPFEEIFREAEPPPGGASGQQENETEKLAELQKQVINATWKTVRRETGPGPTAGFARDAATLLAGEQEALELADRLEPKLASDELRAQLEVARRQMRLAIEQLGKAESETALAPLAPALTAERAAYQALLKLRARQHLVTRGRNSSGAGAAGRSAEQLSELELKSSENRYEQQRAAGEQEQAAQRETREILNRLREMAQRQQDLNARIKQMLASLEAAGSEPEKEEIRRQLKRLRDEEQQILRDADELRNRMEQPANAERMSEARSRLDETRSSVRQASDALAEGKTTQAAAAGARAEQQLEQLRDEFRKQSAGRFNDTMREMRDDARRLDQQEQELGQRLAGLDAPQEKSLRETLPRDELREALERQSDDARKLIEAMRQTVEEAETAEPLLAKKLYDTIRQVHQQRPAESLDNARNLLERGFVDPARSEEQKGRAGIGQMRAGVERAADSVLGDDVEGLRRARDRVAELARAVDQEMRRAQGQPEPEASPGRKPGDSSSASKKLAEDSQTQSSKKAQSATQSKGPTKDSSRGQPGASPSGENPSQSPGEGQGKGYGRQSPSKGEGSGQGSGSEQSPDGQQSQGGQQPAGGDQSPGGQQAQGGQQTPGGQPSRSGARQQAGAPSSAGRGARSGAQNSPGGQSGPGAISDPLTGADFRPWADGLRDVEEMVGDPELRARAAQIRDRAAAMRAEFKRHSEPPNWDLVRDTISKPLAELRERLSEELQQKESNDALVPLDRDPVPRNYTEQVRRYYERLGSGK